MGMGFILVNISIRLLPAGGNADQGGAAAEERNTARRWLMFYWAVILEAFACKNQMLDLSPRDLFC